MKSEDSIGHRDRRDKGREGLAQEELLAANRSRKQWLERSLQAFAHHGVRGERGRHKGRNGQHVEQGVLAPQRQGTGRRQREDLNQWLDEEDQREDRHRVDDVAVVAVLVQLLAEDGPDAPSIQLHWSSASWSRSSKQTSSSV
jgi:hypothetical protein